MAKSILEIAQVCGNEAEKKQILMDLEKRSLDETLCIQYQNILLEWIARERELKGYSKSINQKRYRQHNGTKNKRQLVQTTINRTIHRKLKTNQ
jgi:hypothetical protein